MVSYTTIDLREEINRHRGREDSRIAIERHRERRQNIEDHNLEEDFDSRAPAHGGPIAHAPRPPITLRILGGCMALAPHLCMVVWPHKF
jgi:hypothetical protein